MKYMGSKARHAKEIIEVIQPSGLWVEPFVGGGNVIDKVIGPRLGSDSNIWAIKGLISIKDYLHELPKDNTEFTEEMYNELRTSDSYKHKGFAGFTFSYGGKWLGGWARDKSGKRDYVAEAYKNACKQSPLLQGVTFVCTNYWNLDIPEGSTIYCDPPYAGTTKYKDSFDHERFWQWCREKSRYCRVFVSEYSAPDDFKCVWEKTVNSSLTQNTGSKKAVERLFKWNG